MSYLVSFVLVFFSPFSIAIIRLGKRELILSLICACLDLSVSSTSWCLGRAAVCDCDTPLDFSLTFF